MHKRILPLLLSLFFAGTGCAKEETPPPESASLPEGVTISVDADSVTPEGASFLLLQTTDLDIQYGEAYALQTLTDGAWTDVPTILAEGDYGFHCIAYLLPKDTPQTLTVNWEWLYGSLPAGDYRFCTEYMDFRGTGDFTNYPLTAEFTIE